MNLSQNQNSMTELTHLDFLIILSKKENRDISKLKVTKVKEALLLPIKENLSSKTSNLQTNMSTRLILTTPLKKMNLLLDLQKSSKDLFVQAKRS